MPAYFLDSSAAVKRYARETGSAWVLNLFRFARANLFYAARITHTETVSAIAGKKRGRELTAREAAQAVKRFRKHFPYKFFIIEIDEPTVEKATDLAEKHFLRGYDAIQLAAALKADADRKAVGGDGLIFVCADNNLRNAAQTEGLSVEDPNTHR